jgi:hypothetical protein
VAELSLDYAGLVGDLRRPLAAVEVGQVLLDAAGDVTSAYARAARWCSSSSRGRRTCFPHLSGGEFGPNIFRQDRALNRGWSDEGKRFRALEREAAAAPGTFYFSHLLYQDDTAYPMAIEIGILRDGTLHVDRFQNRYPRGRPG